MKRSVLIFSLTLLVTANAAPSPVPKWERDIKADKSYYTQLSDSEFKSLSPGPTYFPLIIDAWRQRPLIAADFKFQVPTFTKDEDVTLQAVMFSTYKDERLLGKAISELITAGNPHATSIIMKALPRITDPKLQADSLRATQAMGGALDEEVIDDYLTKSSQDVVLAAAALYAAQDYSKASKLLTLAEGASRLHRINLIRFAAMCKDKGDLATWNAVRAMEPAAITAALPAIIGIGADDSFVMKAAGSQDVVLRYSLASLSAALSTQLRKKVLKQFSGDKQSSIRAVAAKVIGEASIESLLPELIKLADDPAVNVRQEAAGSLGKFPKAPVVHALIKLTGDATSLLVCQNASKSLIGLADAIDVDQPLGRALSSSNRHVRLNAYRNLLALGSTTHGKALEKALRKEKDENNIAAGIQALVNAMGDKAENQVMSYGNHKSILVKIAVVDSIGRRNWSKQYNYLKKKSGKESDQDVRQATLQAIGRTGNKIFAKEILWVLKQTKLGSDVSADNRSAACWACSHMRGISETLIKRLYSHVSRAILTAPGAQPSFEDDAVRVSATAGLLLIAARETGKTKELAQRLGEASLRLLEIRAGRGTVPYGPHLEFYADQIRKYTENKPIGAATPRPVTYRFSLKKVIKK